MDTLGTNRQTVSVKRLAKEKIISGAGVGISDDSLTDGTATLGDRMMVRGIQLFFVMSWLLFVCIGLISMKSNPLAIFFIIIPSFWFFGNVRKWRRDQQAARERAAKH
jgi:hypothetical protein